MSAFQAVSGIGQFVEANVAREVLNSLSNVATVRPIRLPDLSDEIVHRSGLVEWQRRKVARQDSRLLH